MLARVYRLTPVLFACCALVFPLLVLWKVFVFFDAIPFWDTFAAFDFYFRFMGGDWSALWAAHNEHRTVLTRLLFLVDFNLLDGTTPFLWLVNMALAGLIALVLVAFVREVPQGRVFVWLPAFLVAVSFSELQKENLYWSFQSQFFLAYLLPLAALYFALLSVTRPERSAAHFALSTALGVLSIGTMANGVLALPVLTVYALLVRMSWQRVALLAVLSVLGIAAFVWDGLPDNAEAPSALEALQENPVNVVHYALTYLGSPFSTANIKTTPILGVILLVLALRAAWRHILRGRASAVEIALLGFMGYILVTAIVTALGRVSFGVIQALSSRYTTPNIMNWCVLLLLYLPWLSATSARAVKTTVAFLVLMILLFNVQLSTLKPDLSATNRMGAALALELGIPDQDQVSHIYPYPRAKEVLALVDKLRDDPKAIFSIGPIWGAADRIGTSAAATMSLCPDPDFRVTPVPGTSWSRLEGPTLPMQSENLLILNKAGIVLGVAIQGRDGTIGYLPQGPTVPLYIGTEVARCGPLTITPAP